MPSLNVVLCGWESKILNFLQEKRSWITIANKRIKQFHLSNELQSLLGN